MDSLKTVKELEKGDLYIKFNILFPKKILTKHKQAIVDVLRQAEQE